MSRSSPCGILSRVKVKWPAHMRSLLLPSKLRCRILCDARFAVEHIDKTTQLQTYRLPWPFAPREYLVRCTDKPGSSGHEAHCTSIDGHPGAPERSDRVRGLTETIWRFKEERDGQTSVHLETIVDPRGGLPTWVVRCPIRLCLRALPTHATLFRSLYGRSIRLARAPPSPSFAP